MKTDSCVAKTIRQRSRSDCVSCPAANAAAAHCSSWWQPPSCAQAPLRERKETLHAAVCIYAEDRCDFASHPIRGGCIIRRRLRSEFPNFSGRGFGVSRVTSTVTRTCHAHLRGIAASGPLTGRAPAAAAHPRLGFRLRFLSKSAHEQNLVREFCVTFLLCRLLVLLRAEIAQG